VPAENPTTASFELNVLARVRLDVAPVPNDVWRTLPFHEETLHLGAAGAIQAALHRVDVEHASAAVVVQGAAGTGKTHMLGWLREQVRRQGGYFVLVSPPIADDFWPWVVRSIVDGLTRLEDDGGTQLQQLLRRWRSHVATRIMGPGFASAGVTRIELDRFVDGMRMHDPSISVQGESAMRALVLLDSDDIMQQDVGYAYLTGERDAELNERVAWGITPLTQAPRDLATDLSRLLAPTGVTVVAVDQVAVALAQTVRSVPQHQSWPKSDAADQLAAGLAELHQTFQRALVVTTCNPGTWEFLRARMPATAVDQFRVAPSLHAVPSAEVAHSLVARRLTAQFAAVGFVPPYPTWPVRYSAFTGAAGWRARPLLRAIGDHIARCVREGRVTELEQFDSVGVSSREDRPVLPDGHDEVFRALDTRFAALRLRANVAGALRPETEDQMMGPLLRAGLTAWMLERQDGSTYVEDATNAGGHQVHARLRTTGFSADRQWSFRAIAASRPAAAMVRLRSAALSAGLTQTDARRKLFVLRNTSWPQGPILQRTLQSFRDSGGQVLTVSYEDLQTLAALRDLVTEVPAHLHAWLTVRRPAHTVELFRHTLPRLADDVDDVVPHEPGAGSSEPALRLDTGNGNPGLLTVESLRHGVITIAGSGSGKTSLINRVIEHCVLRGVSVIVLDPAGSLTELPAGKTATPSRLEDDGRPDTNVGAELVRWSPVMTGEYPLWFSPLPDFSKVDEPDQYDELVDTVVASLAPLAGLDSTTADAYRGRILLREAVHICAQRDRTSIHDLIEVLAELPHAISDVPADQVTLRGLAQKLLAATATDRRLGADRRPTDLSDLLEPPPGSQARVSVIDLSNLPSQGQQQFATTLHTALFTWIRAHPANGRPLSGLLYTNDAETIAPAGAMTASTRSMLALASQGRRYGFGLVYSTSALNDLNPLARREIAVTIDQSQDPAP
jgi:hypothetical protein